jgi:2-polyprenyl-3-methyl-5-hydroxy-6-metoxy-1,4-benzoquinol methylase
MMGILYVVNGNVEFWDDWDHWRNGFCRLLEIDSEEAKLLVENTVSWAVDNYGSPLAELTADSRVSCLFEAVSRTFYGGNRPVLGPPEPTMNCDFIDAKPDTIFAGSISGDQSRLIVGNRNYEFAWLVDRESGRPVAANSIEYDTSYFSGGKQSHCGMKGYLSDADWRLEKARRLVSTVLKAMDGREKHWLATPSAVRVLDVGAAAGYFRKAFSEYKFDHYGTDMSDELIEQCRNKYGFDTWHGDISVLDQAAENMNFQIISLWDVIEHLPYVTEAVKKLTSFLADDGVLVVRTPNLLSLESEILGDYYYSFKLDHMLYFTPRSLTAMMKSVGLSPLYIETDSHLFKGFLGADYLYQQSKALRGADILAVYAKQ